MTGTEDVRNHFFVEIRVSQDQKIQSFKWIKIDWEIVLAIFPHKTQPRNRTNEK